jgi:hypothetical protein
LGALIRRPFFFPPAGFIYPPPAARVADPMAAPDIKPIKQKQWDIPASRYPQCAKLPLRSIILAPSGGGKGVLLQNMVLDIYRNCFERVYIMSPSISVDSAWLPVKKYLLERKMSEKTGDRLFFDTYEPEALEAIISQQRQVVEYQKQEKHKRLYQILIIVDDFADDPAFSRNSKLLHSLFTRGRHLQISTIVATQKYTAVSPIVRVNATELYIFKLRSSQDLSTVIEENSALLDKATLTKVYQLATEEPYSFLFLSTTEKTLNQMFMVRFDRRIRFS